MGKKKQACEIELLQEGKVYLKLSDSGHLLSLQWYPKESRTLEAGNDEIIDPFEVGPGLDSYSKDNKVLKRIGESYGSSIVFRGLSQKVKIKLKQALIEVLKEEEESTISTIISSVINKSSESRKFPREQPQMSTELVLHFFKYDRLHELTEYLVKYYPHIMSRVDQIED